MKKRLFLSSAILLIMQAGYSQVKYPIVDTGQNECYSNNRVIDMPEPGQDFYGQDACIQGNQPKYKDNGDGTVTDLVTGLMWEKDMGEKLTFEEAKEKAEKLRTGGYDDWRVPTIKELYSLIQFTGRSMGERVITPYIDTDYFNQPIGDKSKGEREIDAQTWSSTVYKGKTMGGQTTVFGVNFLDGRIKGYPLKKRREDNKMYFRMVRGNTEYGKNQLVDNGDGTITDYATGLMWQKADDGNLYDWKQALAYADTLSLAGYSDWYLPNAKELESIVDYSRSPSATNSPAISPLFECSKHKLYDDIDGYAYYWSSTTHLDGPNPYKNAVYVCFGEAWGRKPRTNEFCDVHGAGAQRSDPKSGSLSEYPRFFGPQKDMLCVFNAVRCVRKIKFASMLTMHGQDKNWRFAVVGDTHVPRAYTIKKIIPSLIENKVEVVLFVGDLIQGGKGQNAQGMYEELSQWKELTQPLRDAGIKIIAIRGNHEADVKGDNLKPWKELISPDLNLVSTYRNVTFIGMDNYLDGEHTVDTGWLKKVLKEVNKDNIIVPFGHEPAFTCNTFHPVCLDANESSRNKFWSLLEEYGIDYYFCGHTHQYNHCTVTHDGKTIHQIVSGGGGGFLQPKRGGIQNADGYKIEHIDLKSETGYVLVNVSDRSLSTKWVGIYDEDVKNKPMPQRKNRLGGQRKGR